MRILIGWDDSAEADLISLYLNVDQNEAKVTTKPDEFLVLAQRESWDVVLIALTFPEIEQAFITFEHARELLNGVPIIGASRPLEVYQLARFVAAGLHSHIMRT